jgi:transposase
MDGTRAASPSSFGWAGPVHCKCPASQEVRTLLVARKQLLGKLLDVEFSIRGILRGFGLRMGVVTRNGFEARVSEQCVGQAMLEQIVEAMLAARAAMWKEYSKLRKAMLVIVRRDEISWRLMSVPGVGPLVAITFKTAIDNPARIRKSKAVGALLALTPRKYHSGETDVTGSAGNSGRGGQRAGRHHRGRADAHQRSEHLCGRLRRPAHNSFTSPRRLGPARRST